MTNHITKIIFLNKYTKGKTIEEIQERFNNLHYSNELYFSMLEVLRNDWVEELKSYI